MELRKEFRNELILWWEENKRNFPWRETIDPYKILCSEILLQQTNAEKVEKIYNKLLNKFPEVDNLAEAEISELEELINPLGLIYRAERLKKIAQISVEKYEGEIPQKKENLMKLPGVGHYAANAVMSFAYEKEFGVLDTNTIRILKRFFGITSDKSRPRNDSKLREEINDLVKGYNSRKINYALLDFASLICTKLNPHCSECPLLNLCKKCGVSE